MSHIFIKEFKPGLFRVLEVVGENPQTAEVLTIEWDGLHDSKQSCVKAIEANFKRSLTEDEYKALMFNPATGLGEFR